MRITHTNRKGVTFYLGRGVTKTGKPRYFFAREPDKVVVSLTAFRDAKPSRSRRPRRFSHSCRPRWGADRAVAC